MEDAIFLAKTSKPVYIIQRNDRFRASAVMLKRARETEGVVFLTHTVVTDAFYDDKYEPSDMKKKPSYRYMNALRLARTDGGVHSHPDIKDGVLPLAGLFFAIGHDPATKLVKGQLELNEEGYIKIIAGTDTATSIPGVHASGDCQDFKYRQAVRAISSGCEAAMNVNRWLIEH
jgi:thioredoxin reductase (NADPH)